jgi:hypothetical protein
MMTEVTMTAVSHLLIGLLGATGLVLSLVTLWKENQFSHRLSGIFSKAIVWSALALIGLCAIILSVNSVETVRALDIISSHVEAVIRQY